DVINQGRMIDELDRDEGVALMGEKEEEKKVEEHAKKEPEVQEVVEVVTTTKLITEVVTAASTPVSAASTIIPAAEPNIPAVTIITAPVKVVAASTRRRRRVVIRDPEEESTAINPAETKSNDKGKGVETPLFEGMLVAEEIEEQNDAEEQIQGNDNDAQGADAHVSGDAVQD
nr:hypothetical protein [Tanacetum cinerariifolium]